MSTSSQARRVSNFSQPNSRQRRLFVEGLEHRQVLAGNVLATMVGGNLVIQGDAAENGIHLQSAADGTVEVSGIDAGGAATTINGQAEPFTASNVRTFTRVSLGNGNDQLELSAEASVDGETGGGDRWLLGNLLAKKHLMINTGRGDDSVSGQVASNVSVHLQGNQGNDSISIETLADVDAEVDLDVGLGGRSSAGDSSRTENGNHTEADLATAANLGASAGIAADLAGHLSSGLLNQVSSQEANVNVDANVDASVDVDAALDSALDGTVAAADLNLGANAAADVAADIAANATGIGTNLDIDSAITANLLLDPALNSSANIGRDALLNGDNNLNGSIGGSAALNLLGDGAFDEIGQFNASGIANLLVNDAANLALLNANTFALTENQADDFFADFGNQSSLNANADVATQAGLLANLGNLDTQAGAGLSGSLNTSYNGVFSSRLGAVPLA